MILNEMVYAGVEISSGSCPLVLAALNQDLKVILLERYSASNLLKHVQQHEYVMLAVNVPFRNQSTSNGNRQKIFNALAKEIFQAGFKPYLANHACRQWVETYPSECYSALIGQTPLPRRSVKGRVQRASILHEQGLQIHHFKRFSDGVYNPAELDALMAASIAWMLFNEPVKIDLTREPDRQMISIPREDKGWWRKKPV